ncbi:hypothetical protein K0504_02355 [Neiella marina]|uniref:Uncharacterized protein n=1 Tax=Neiella holothuriorum TaxID=2870530 RepID=A0ABS7EC11_9GAMM|nr:hypothetical protein [Neiella holothuriorum]MBW8189864.1 hypothetical protein [Neiella holothuriorum]
MTQTHFAADVGESGFVTIQGERFYAIKDYDQMPPFFISLVSSSDHWLFISSTGALTAGRMQPENALFPYESVDKIHANAHKTGSKSLFWVSTDNGPVLWQPFVEQGPTSPEVTRTLYKNLLGSKLVFSETNHELGLRFSYSWSTSEEYGFVRQSYLENLTEATHDIKLLDGVTNLLPWAVPRKTQTEASCLVDAYKWNELDATTNHAVFALYAAISDRAEPSESLKATGVFSLGLPQASVLLSTRQLEAFRMGRDVSAERLMRAEPGAYLLTTRMKLAGNTEQSWMLVADVSQSQSDVVATRQDLVDNNELPKAIAASVAANSDELARLMAQADGFQTTAEENVSAHHYANVLFNVMRGGIFNDQYQVPRDDFAATLSVLNKPVWQRHQNFLNGLPEVLSYQELHKAVMDQDDPQLERLCYEYLPITFGRRHGDPSRPWNHFEIKLTDDAGNRLLSYQGNWRDIFQNWEALAVSYPDFIENVIAKFVNASTIDGYNPYRITKDGIDWELDEPDDPWSNIGYWGDHQIIYLLKLLEASQQFHPAQLQKLLQQPLFCYANVPYTIKPFNALVADFKNTVDFDHDKAKVIDQRVADMGSDGKLVLTKDGEVYQVNLFEKLLVPLLSKLSNLVVDGGIWLNSQRPEWNDANNALVGQGLSMVTMYYMRRYISFMQRMLKENDVASYALSTEVAKWLADTAAVFAKYAPQLNDSRTTDEFRWQLLRDLGEAACAYRDVVYQQGFAASTEQSVDTVLTMLDNAQIFVDHSIAQNVRQDGLYEAYNLLDVVPEKASVDYLYPMLEGQVAALSAGVISPQDTVKVLDSLFASEMWRADQKTFMLYPDRDLPSFLGKNRVSEVDTRAVPLLNTMLDKQDSRIIERDVQGDLRFNAEFHNAGDLLTELATLVADYGDEVAQSELAVLDLYESVFNHKAFTGRSGTMFGYEGLGSIYWHMVSKLLLAVQENYFSAIAQGADSNTLAALRDYYYRVREGIGFNKTPEEYGSFPCDPYSHTPSHLGAQQPGMTGQVKEEVLTRWGELGLRIWDGEIRFEPSLLRPVEFTREATELRYLDLHGDWQQVAVPADSLAFTFCQVPLRYQAIDAADAVITLHWADGRTESFTGLVLNAEISQHLFARDKAISQIDLALPKAFLNS